MNSDCEGRGSEELEVCLGPPARPDAEHKRSVTVRVSVEHEEAVGHVAEGPGQARRRGPLEDEQRDSRWVEPCKQASVLVGRRARPVEDELGDLPALDARPVGALHRALELERDGADDRLADALLPEVAELHAVQDCGRGVEALGLHLDRVLEVHVERVWGAVGEELGVVLGQDSPQAFQFDLDGVVGRAVRRAV